MNKEKTQIPVARADLLDERWMKTPFVFSTFGADFTLLQQRVMIHISLALQEEIKRYLAKPTSGKHLYADGSILRDFRIYFKELGLLPANYNDIYEEGEDGKPVIAAQMLGLATKIYDEEKRQTEWYNVFSRVIVPDKENFYHTTHNADGTTTITQKKEGYIQVALNPDILSYTLDMSMGYVQHLRRITEFAKKKCTPRVYLLLMRQYGLKKSNVKIPFKDFKQYVGAYKENENGEVSESYVKYNYFAARVIDSAKEDLERMALQNQTEITFDYKPVYPKGKKRGNPDFLEFKIKETLLGRSVKSLKMHRASVRSLVAALVKRCPDFNQNELTTFFNRIPIPIFPSLSDYAYKDVWTQVEKKQPDNVAAYVMRLMTDYVKKSIPQSSKQPMQLSMHFENEGRINYIRQWALCQQSLCKLVGDEVARRTFAELSFESYDEQTRHLVLQTTVAARAEIEDRYIEKFRESLIRYFGFVPELGYRLKPAQQ